MSKIINDQLIISSIAIITTVLLILSLSGIKYSSAQTYEKVISLPDVNITNSNNQKYSLDEEFLLVNNQGNDSQNPLEILNPNFGLNPPFVNIHKGQEYTVNPPNNEDIQYSNVTVKIAQVLFIAPGIKIQDADPEDPDTMTLGGQTDIAHFGAGKGGSFIIPPNIKPGNYILYVYVQYPYGITGVFSNFVTIGLTGSNSNSNINWMSICNTIQPALIPSCSSLVNPDNTLTQQGQDALKCIKTGALMGGGATLLGAPPGLVTKGLSILAAPTGCGGIVDMKALQNIAGLNSILNMLP